MVLPNKVPVFFSPPPRFPKLKDILKRMRDLRVLFQVCLWIERVTKSRSCGLSGAQLFVFGRGWERE